MLYITIALANAMEWNRIVLYFADTDDSYSLVRYICYHYNVSIDNIDGRVNKLLFET